MRALYLLLLLLSFVVACNLEMCVRTSHIRRKTGKEVKSNYCFGIVRVHGRGHDYSECAATASYDMVLVSFHVTSLFDIHLENAEYV